MNNCYLNKSDYFIMDEVKDGSTQNAADGLSGVGMDFMKIIGNQKTSSMGTSTIDQCNFDLVNLSEQGVKALAQDIISNIDNNQIRQGKGFLKQRGPETLSMKKKPFTIFDPADKSNWLETKTNQKRRGMGYGELES